MDKLNVLHEYFGHTAFRHGQDEIIDSILSGRDCLGVMPTGAGKSICYQIPALMFRGITIVVSPLISLMKDQVNSLIQAGVRAAYLNSSLTAAQYEKALANCKQGVYKIIYVAPERLCTPQFLHFAQNAEISMLTVDEAHCVSQWGQDFRPSYLKIAEFASLLNKRPIISAFTATATDAVKKDIAFMLGLENPYTITTGFDRANLYFGVEKPKDKLSAAVDIIQRNSGKSGIVYCTTRKNVEEVCMFLQQRGYSATRYHAGLCDDERRQNQDDFIYDRRSIMVATNAFGMGIDKSNVSFCIHYNMPKNLESYYQEAGRCGRDGSIGECILLYSGQDVRINKFLIQNSNDNSNLDAKQLEICQRRDLDRLRAMTFYCTTADCLRGYILKYFGENAPAQCGNCSNCNTNFETVDITIDSQKILSCIFRLKSRKLSFGASVVTACLRGGNDIKIRNFGLNTLSTYGIMKDSSTTRIRQIINHLTSEGYIVQGEYQTLMLTEKSKEILFERKEIFMQFAPEKSSGKEKIFTSNEVYAIDTALLEQIKELRKSQAMVAKVPVYIIFSDSTLRDMCLKMPRNEIEFMEISGVGAEKCRRYCKAYTQLICKYMNENNIQAEGATSTNEYLARLRESRTPCDSSSLFDIIISRQGELKASDEEMSLMQVCDDILSQLGLAANKRLLRDRLRDWLSEKGLILYNGSKIIGCRQGADVGILQRFYMKNGAEYTKVIFAPSAQEFIIDNIDTILQG